MKSGIAPVLAEGKVMDEKLWLRFVQVRVDSIRQHLNRFALGTIGDVQIFSPGSMQEGLHQIKTDKPTVPTKGYSLNTQGMFWLSTTEEDVGVYGLNRDGEWIVANLTFRDGKMGEVRPPEKDHFYRYVTAISVVNSDPQEICGRFLGGNDDTAYAILFDKIGDVIKKWHQRAESLSTLSSGLFEMVERDKELLQLIQSQR